MSGDLGPLCIGVSTIFFASHTAVIKLIDVPPILLLQIRGVIMWALTILVILVAQRTGLLRADVRLAQLLWGETGERRWLLLRAVTYIAGVLLYWTSLECMPAGDCTALVQSFLFTNLLARLILKEPLRRVLLLCAPLHVLGVVLIGRPRALFSTPTSAQGTIYASDPMHLQQRAEGVVAATGSAVFFGALPILTRLARRSHWVALEHTNNCFCTFVAAPALLAAFLLIEQDESHVRAHSFGRAVRSSLREDVVPLLAVVPFLSFCAIALQTIGYQVTRSAGLAALMAPLEIPLATFLQAAVFGTRDIDALSLLGTALIVIACVINGYAHSREQPHAPSEQEWAAGSGAARRKYDDESAADEDDERIGGHGHGFDGFERSTRYADDEYGSPSGRGGLGPDPTRWLSYEPARDPLRDVSVAAFEAESEQLEAENEAENECRPLLGADPSWSTERDGLLPWERRRPL